jgi:hypothetical protein
VQHSDTRAKLDEAAFFSRLDLRADGNSITKPIRVMGVPFKLDNGSLPEGFRQVSDRYEVPDAVILNEPNAARFLSDRLGPALAMVILVVDSCRGGDREFGHIAPGADVFINTVSRTFLDSLANQIEPMIARLRDLLPALSGSPALENVLLARLLVRNRGLVPRRDPGSRNIVEYVDSYVFPNLLVLAEKLVQRGLLKRRFFDVLSICPYCDSARVYSRPRPACTRAEASSVPTMTEQAPGSICLDCSHEMLASMAVERLTYAYDLNLTASVPFEDPDDVVHI